jgi:putative DNA primase/helicase
VHLPLGKHRLPCPECKKAKRDSALAVKVECDGAVWLCHRCGFAGSERDRSHTAKPGAPRPTSTPKVQLELAANYREFWYGLKPLQGTAASYLKARGCAIPPTDSDLRCTESLRHPSGYTGPALVAMVTDAETRAPLTLHRTWIKANGEKADVGPPRMLLGKHSKQNGVIRLSPDDAVTTGLAIAEGIETALTLALAYRPVWSLIDAGNLAAFPVLDGIESLLIAADNDAAGLKASAQCAERWYRAGRQVRICKSPIPGQDLNDFARAAA